MISVLVSMRADGAAGVPGPAPVPQPSAPAASDDTGMANPLWFLFPAIAKKVQAGASPDMYQTARAGDSLVPFTSQGQVLDAETQVRPAVNGDQIEAFIDGQWTVVDEPDDALVQQAITQQYGSDVGDGSLAYGDVDPNADFSAAPVANDAIPALAPPAPIDAASVPIGTDEVIPPAVREPPALLTLNKACCRSRWRQERREQRTQESKERREAAKEKRKKSGAGKAAKAVRGAKK